MKKVTLATLERQTAAHQAAIHKIEQQKQSIIEQEIADMMRELNEVMDTANTLVSGIKSRNPEFKAPWMDGCREGKRIYAHPNVFAAIHDVLEKGSYRTNNGGQTWSGTMTSKEIVAAVLKQFPSEGYSAKYVEQKLCSAAGHVGKDGLTIRRIKFTKDGWDQRLWNYYKK